MSQGEKGVKIPGGPGDAPAAAVGPPGATGAESAATGPVDPPPAAMNPAALTVAQAARLLGVAEQKVHDHVAAGLPVGPGETINLVHYAAWLNQRLAENDGD